jgi:hypothetical protein
MKLHLERLDASPLRTIGSLDIDGQWECWTLEDPVRPDGIKIAGETAIPKGLYRVELTQSPRFKRVLPLLINVQGFVGIRIHPGNTVWDTEGCILVGQERFALSLGKSRAAFDLLFDKMVKASQRRETIVLQID